VAWAEETAPIPVYQTLDELAGKRFAYVNGSVYNQRIQALLDGTTEEFYASLPDCVAAVEAGKVDAAVQLSYCCQIVVNRKGGTVALLPVAAGRRWIIQAVFGGELYSRGEDLSVHKQGVPKIALAVLLATAVYFAVFVWVDAAGTRSFGFCTLRWLLSTMVSTLLEILLLWK
jgi:hypothetical protein